MTSADAASTLPVEAPETGPDQPEQAPRGDGTGPDHDAARYRRQLRDVESEVAGLRTRVETMQRGEVERMAATSNVAKPGSIWADVEMADLLDPAGNVDPDKAQQAIDRAVVDLGLSVRSQLRPDMSQGSRGAVPAESSWQTLLNGGGKEGHHGTRNA